MGGIKDEEMEKMLYGICYGDGSPCVVCRGRCEALLDIGRLCRARVIGEGMKLKTSPGIGFFSLMAIYILTIVIGLMLYYGFQAPKKKQK